MHEYNYRVWSCSYDDFILNYDVNIDRLIDFLKEQASVHIKKKEHFNPEVSKKNIGLWKKLPDQTNIKKIEDELRELLF